MTSPSTRPRRRQAVGAAKPAETPEQRAERLAPKQRVSVASTFKAVGYQPHQVQKEIHKAQAWARFQVVCAGRRTGKSTLGGHRLGPEALSAYYQSGLSRNGRRKEFWIVGPEYTDAEKEFRVLWNDLELMGVPFDKPGSYNDVNSGNMHISLWDGRFQVHAKSAKYPGQLVGEGLDGVILAEAAKLKPSVWHKYIRPMLADHRGWALLSSTPEGRNWFYDEYVRGQDPQERDAYSVRMPSWSNNILFPEGRLDPEILSLERGMTEEKFKQEIGAEFNENVGAVFKRWEEDSHTDRLEYNPRYPIFIAQDAGYTNPTVLLWLQVDVFNNVNVLAEYYERGRTPDEVIDEVLADPRLSTLTRAAVALYPDPADPGTAQMMGRKFGVSVEGNTGGSLDVRLNLIRRWLRKTPDQVPTDEDNPVLTVDRRCRNLIREMGDYRYPESKEESRVSSGEPELPMKKDDHTPEALGRFFKGFFGTTEMKRQSSRQKTAKFR